MNLIHETALIPEDAIISDTTLVGPRVTLAGPGISLGASSRLDAGCIIGDHVSVGQGAWVRAGAVVLNSVPPNAIVEGNPAKVVGYVTPVVDGERPATRLIDVAAYRDLPRPAQIPLDVGDSALYLMRRITDARGALSVGEVPSELPFAPARYFVVFDVPSEELRGEHAHLKCQQFLICLHGSCRVFLDDGSQRCELTLDRPDMGVFMPAMIWGTQYRYSQDAVLMVFASRAYEAHDYLRTYDEFLAESQKHQP